MEAADKRLLPVHEAMMVLAFVLASLGSMANAPIYAALSVLLAGSVLIDGALRELRLYQQNKTASNSKPKVAAQEQTVPASMPAPTAISTFEPHQEAPRTLLWD